MVFHSARQLGILFAHVAPAFLCHSLLQEGRLHTSWPGCFPVLPAERSSADLLYFGLTAYGLWYVIYAPWLIITGLHYPEKYNLVTVFSYIYCTFDMPNRYNRWFGIKTLRQCAAMFSAMHLGVSSAFIVLSTVYLHFEIARVFYLIFITGFIMFNGSTYYISGLTRRYDEVVETLLVPAVPA